MHNDQPDKRTLPINGPGNQHPQENDSSAIPDNDNEQDPDELAHTGTVEEIPENEEIDADDVIHHSITPSVNTLDSEKDPDDLVHGK